MNLIHVPLPNLIISPNNVRKTGTGDVAALAAASQASVEKIPARLMRRAPTREIGDAKPDLSALIRSLAKKAARDHMRTNPNRSEGLQVPRAEHVGLSHRTPAA